VRVDAQAVDAPHTAREIAPRAPRVLEVPLAVPLHHLGGAAIGAPDVARAVHDDQVEVRRRLADAPHADELAVLVEHLDAAVVAIVDVDEVLHWVDGDAVDAVEVVGPRLGLLRGPLAL